MAATQTLLRAVPDPADTKQRIASSIEALVDIAGLKRSEVAARAGIDPTALSKSLHGNRRISAIELERLAIVLDVPTQVFYDGGDEIRRRARAGVLTASGPDTPPDQGFLPRACNGDLLRFRARGSHPAAVAA